MAFVVLQATSQRGITHLVNPDGRTLGRNASRTYKALCGAEVGRKGMAPGDAKPGGKMCLRCTNGLSRLTRHYLRVLEITTKAVEGKSDA